MTCIVGIEFEGRVYLGGDVQGSSDNNKVVHTQPKVFNKNGVIFGYTTSYRFGQILEHNLPAQIVPRDDKEIYRWLVCVLIPQIRETLDSFGYEGGGTCLIGISNQLWSMQDDFSVLRSVTGYTACGSGVEYALGALFTYVKNNHLTKSSDSCKNGIEQAILAAHTFCPSVGADAVIISTKKST
jgi:ATP-dependent protease HslVU (ClpYQ) peptidase subunit